MFSDFQKFEIDGFSKPQLFKIFELIKYYNENNLDNIKYYFYENNVLCLTNCLVYDCKKLNLNKENFFDELCDFCWNYITTSDEYERALFKQEKDDIDGSIKEGFNIKVVCAYSLFIKISPQYIYFSK